MSSLTLTADDIRHCRETWESICDEIGEDPTAFGSLHGYDVIMTSIGYVEVQHDGAVVAFGRVLCNVADG